MTLQQRIALHYGVVVLIALLLLGGLTYHEFSTERRLRKALGSKHQTEGQFGESAEVFVYAMIPVVLLTGWWFARRSLRPLSDLARGVEGKDVETLRDLLPRTGNGDEIDRLTAAFNIMIARLDKSFTQIREFTLHASHELKTPLTVMRGELETALRLDADTSPSQRESLHNLLDEVDRLTKIVNDLTTLTKADAGQIPLDLQPVRLAELVRECFEDAQVMAEPQQVRVTLGECADLVVRGDRHRLRQLLLNLADNAVKYNDPAGAVTIGMRQDAAAAIIDITNTGKGIPPELQPHIFNRFVRGADAASRAVEGCGLGLAICRWIVQAHSGTIEITSVPGQTTTATVRLPLL